MNRSPSTDCTKKTRIGQHNYEVGASHRLYQPIRVPDIFKNDWTGPRASLSKKYSEDALPGQVRFLTTELEQTLIDGDVGLELL